MKKNCRLLSFCIVVAILLLSMVFPVMAEGTAGTSGEKVLDFMPLKGQSLVITPTEDSGGGKIETPTFNADGSVNMKLTADGWPAIKMDINKKVKINELTNIQYSIEGTAKWNLIFEYEGAVGGDGKGTIGISQDFYGKDEIAPETGIQNLQGCFTWDGAPRTLPEDGIITITTAKLFVVGTVGQEIKVNYLHISGEAIKTAEEQTTASEDTASTDENTAPAASEDDNKASAASTEDEKNPKTGDGLVLFVEVILVLSALSTMLLLSTKKHASEK